MHQLGACGSVLPSLARAQYAMRLEILTGVVVGVARDPELLQQLGDLVAIFFQQRTPK
jgi:hypothetical protein